MQVSNTISHLLSAAIGAASAVIYLKYILKYTKSDIVPKYNKKCRCQHIKPMIYSMPLQSYIRPPLHTINRSTNQKLLNSITNKNQITDYLTVSQELKKQEIPVQSAECDYINHTNSQLPKDNTATHVNSTEITTTPLEHSAIVIAELKQSSDNL